MDAYTGGNTTGFASPASDSLEGTIDLSDILDLRRPSRYPVRVTGEALASRHILPGDILIIDAALPPIHGRVAVVMIQGAVLVAQLAYRRGEWWLQSGRSECPTVPMRGDEAEIWGIASGLVRTEI